LRAPQSALSPEASFLLMPFPQSIPGGSLGLSLEMGIMYWILCPHKA
jgi:hypothetical protein